VLPSWCSSCGVTARIINESYKAKKTKPKYKNPKRGFLLQKKTILLIIYITQVNRIDTDDVLLGKSAIG